MLTAYKAADPAAEQAVAAEFPAASAVLCFVPKLQAAFLKCAHTDSSASTDPAVDHFEYKPLEAHAKAHRFVQVVPADRKKTEAHSKTRYQYN